MRRTAHGVATVLRHTAFFLYREDSTPAQRVMMLKGLAYLRFECKSVVAVDYGTDLFGGSSVLGDADPRDRTPRWRAAEVGPPSNFDVALMLDFADQERLQDYNEDEVHHEVSKYNAAVCQPEMTARVDWVYDGDPLINAGHVRHSAMFVWRDDADDAAKERAFAHAASLESVDGVDRVTVASNVGPMKTDFDWILDVDLLDGKRTKAMLGGREYGEAMAAIAAATKYEWTARLSHVMRGM
jgi:hypothetical protein